MEIICEILRDQAFNSVQNKTPTPTTVFGRKSVGSLNLRKILWQYEAKGIDM